MAMQQHPETVGPVLAKHTSPPAALRPYILVVALSAAASAYFSAAGLLLHFSFRSYGWDLGIFDQVLWNTAHGRLFEYSFRNILYLGDHFSPALLLLSPLALLGAGPAPLLVAQGIAFGAACIPLFAAVRRLAGPGPAWFVTSAYVLGLAQGRAVTYDFHPDAFIPLFAFTALWGLASGRKTALIAASLAILTVKEDMALLVLGLCWVAWLAFGAKREAAVIAVVGIVYSAVVVLAVMPEIRGDDTNPLSERYGYLGDNAPEMLFNAVTQPHLIFDQLNRWSAFEAVALVLLGAGLLPLATPRLWPPLALLLLAPLLAQHPAQSTLSLHYMVVPATFALVVAAVALKTSEPWSYLTRFSAKQVPRSHVASLAVFACAVAVFAWKSPLPPSFAAEPSRYQVDSHSRLARSFVDDVPDGVGVSAQATFVPHLSQREDIYEFPRIEDADWVLLDEKRPVPSYDQHGFDDCRRELPALGFDIVRQEDRITLWQRTRQPEEDATCG